jgi:hypothetical protein
VTAVGDRVDAGTAAALGELRDRLAAEPQRPARVPPTVFRPPPELDGLDEEAQQ